jgi:hypothetical protein
LRQLPIPAGGPPSDIDEVTDPAVQPVHHPMRWRGGDLMKKMSIRKAGTIRLTSACYYCCSAA